MNHYQDELIITWDTYHNEKTTKGLSRRILANSYMAFNRVKKQWSGLS